MRPLPPILVGPPRTGPATAPRRGVSQLLLVALLPGLAFAAAAAAQRSRPATALAVAPQSVTVAAGATSSAIALSVSLTEPVEAVRLEVDLPAALRGNTKPEPARVLVQVGRDGKGSTRIGLVTTAATPAGRHVVAFRAPEHRLRTEIVLVVTAPVRPSPAGDFGLALRPGSLDLCAGGAPKAVEATLEPREGFRGSVALSWSPLPRGIDVHPDEARPRALPPGQRIPFEITAARGASGSSTLHLEAVDGERNLRRQASVDVAVAQPDFALRFEPSRIDLQAGGPAVPLRLAIKPNRCLGAGEVTLRLKGAPRGLEVSATSLTLAIPQPAPAPASVTLAPSAELAPGNYRLLAEASGPGGLRRRAAVSVRVRRGAVDPQRPEPPERPAPPEEPGAREQPGAPERPGKPRQPEPPGPPERPRRSQPPEAAEPPRQQAPPAVERIRPQRIEPGRTYSLELTGRGFVPAMTLDLGPDIELVGPPQVISPRFARATVEVRPDARPGARTARLTTADQTADGPATIWISALGRTGLPQPLVPRVDKLFPDEVEPGERYHLRLSGPHLSEDTELDFGQGIRLLEPPEVLGEGLLRVHVEVAPNARPGSHQVRAASAAGFTHSLASLGVVPPSSGKNQQATTSPVYPGLATLSFAAISGVELSYTLGPTEKTAYGGGPEGVTYGLEERLAWQSPYAHEYAWRWQVSLQPFPATAGLEPPGLVASRQLSGQPVSGTVQTFWIDFSKVPPLGAPSPTAFEAGTQTLEAFVPAAPGSLSAAGEGTAAVTPPPNPWSKSTSEHPVTGEPPPPPGEAPKGPGGAQLVVPQNPTVPDLAIDFYIRLVPLLPGGALAGPPSNTVVLHYEPGADPDLAALEETFAKIAEQQKLIYQMTEEAKVYDVALLSWKPAVFADINRWGCIVVVTNPYHGKTFHPLSLYVPGHEYCPPKDPSKMEKSTGEKILEGAGGFLKAWDGLAWAVDQAKQWVASKFAQTFPCEWLGDDLESDCESVAKEVAEAAISAGLVAAGMPPSLPTVAELQGMAEGKVVDGAVYYTCDALESNGGTCTPEMRAALAKIFQEALDQLQKDLTKQAQEPGCGDVQTAGDHGLLPLPCFNNFPGTEVKPATGSIYESPQVTVRMRRLKPDPGFPLACRVQVRLFLENYFPGDGNVYAPISTKYEGPIQGHPFESAQAEIPNLAVGQSTVLTVSLGPQTPFHLPGSQAGPYFAWSDWLALYVGGKGPLSASTWTEAIVTYADLPERTLQLACSPDATVGVAMPAKK